MLAIENATCFDDPFPHLQLFPALDNVSFDRTRALLPPPQAFELKGKGLKLELDVIEGTAAFDALDSPQRDSLLALRQGVRDAAARITERFAAPLRDKYVWLLGQTIAADVLAAGWTTTAHRTGLPLWKSVKATMYPGGSIMPGFPSVIATGAVSFCSSSVAIAMPFAVHCGKPSASTRWP